MEDLSAAHYIRGMEINMVYTLTFNPSLDYTLEFDDISPGRLNRAKSTAITPGGKGINVSRILTGLGVDNLILGFTAGFTGDEIERSLKGLGCRSEFIKLDRGCSRINVKVRSGSVTELNAPGPEISRDALFQLFNRLDRLAKDDYLVLAGNIPGGLPDYTCGQILEKMNSKEVRTIVDMSGAALLSALGFEPFLIKPNRQELEELFCARRSSREDSEKYIRRLQEKGARNVLVSLDSEGAILLTENNELYYQAAPEGKVINPVGAGDSMVAGFIWGFIRSGDYREALKCGVSAGSASAFSPDLALGEDIKALRSLMGLSH